MAGVWRFPTGFWAAAKLGRCSRAFSASLDSLGCIDFCGAPTAGARAAFEPFVTGVALQDTDCEVDALVELVSLTELKIALKDVTASAAMGTAAVVLANEILLAKGFLMLLI